MYLKQFPFVRMAEGAGEAPVSDGDQAASTGDAEKVAAASSADGDAAGDDDSKVNWKQESRKWEDRAKKNRAESKTLKEQLQQRDESIASLQKQLEEFEELKLSAEESQLEATRFRIALEHNLPADMAVKVLHGSEEDMREQAALLIPHVKGVGRGEIPGINRGEAGTSKEADTQLAYRLMGKKQQQA